MSLENPSQQRSTPRRLAKVGLLGLLFGAGVLEFASFAFFGCPCVPQMVVPNEDPGVSNPPEDNSAPARLGTPKA